MIARLVSVPILLMIGVYALVIGLAEARASAQIDRPLAQILAEASGGAIILLPARSHRFRRAQMDVCLRSASDPAALVFPPSAVAALVFACQERAAGILADAPANAAALAVASQTHGAQFLDRSWASAPFEGWLAAHRFALGLARPATASGTLVYEGMADDAALLVGLGQVDQVAIAYVDLEGFRKVFASKIATLPAADQRRFLAAAEALRSGGDDGL